MHGHTTVLPVLEPCYPRPLSRCSSSSSSPESPLTPVHVPEYYAPIDPKALTTYSVPNINAPYCSPFDTPSPISDPSNRYMASNSLYPSYASPSLSPMPIPAPHPMQHQQSAVPHSPSSPNSKTYSFVSLPGNAVKKRPRRRYDEIERPYKCSWRGCDKAYGTLNHLNNHVVLQGHGEKRNPAEFKELRMQLKLKKKSASTATAANGGGAVKHESSSSPRGVSQLSPASSHAVYQTNSSLEHSPSYMHNNFVPTTSADLIYPSSDASSPPHPSTYYSSQHRHSYDAQYQQHSYPSPSYEYHSSSSPTAYHTHSTFLEPYENTSPTSEWDPRGSLPSDSSLFTPLSDYQGGGANNNGEQPSEGTLLPALRGAQMPAPYRFAEESATWSRYSA